LVIVARDADEWPFKRDDGSYCLTSGQAKELFQLMISRWYGDAYMDDEAYQKHLHERLGEVLSRIGNGDLALKVAY
jgi:hypothetical protein